MAAYPPVYGLWTNKGGVGKTTLTYHLATTYAELFPKKDVVVIDMCPQANLSSTLLTFTPPHPRTPREDGDIKVHMLHEAHKIYVHEEHKYPKTVAGYFINYDGKRVQIKPEEWLINVNTGVAGHITGNEHMPDNLYLFCGDTALNLLVDPLTRLAGGVGNSYKDVRMLLREYIASLAKHYQTDKEKKGRELVVFIDTNPALTIYTEIALVAMTELIIPVNADNFSKQAVSNMFHLVYGLYRTKGAASVYEDTTFAYKATALNIPIPAISAIVHNKTPVSKNSVNPNDSFKRPKAYRELATSHAGLLFDGYQRAQLLEQVDRVFKPRKETFKSNELLAFSAAYTGTMRDMCSCGIAALHTGLPLSKLVEKKNLISKEFNTNSFIERTPYVIKDILMLMDTVLGEAIMKGANNDAKKKLERLSVTPDDSSNQAAVAAPTAASDGAAAGGNPSTTQTPTSGKKKKRHDAKPAAASGHGAQQAHGQVADVLSRFNIAARAREQAEADAEALKKRKRN